MAVLPLAKIFLAASIPLPERDPIFFESADVTAIRDAVRAITRVVVPHAQLVWGGHPSITPLIRYVLQRDHVPISPHVRLYQSKFFEANFPEDNFHFEDVCLVERQPSREGSLTKMRDEMLGLNSFAAGVFIGGMEGVLEEFMLFTERNPKALLLPVGSTGGAAKILYDNFGDFPTILWEERAYMAMFKKLLGGIINQ